MLLLRFFYDKRIDEDMRLFLKWLRTKGINTSRLEENLKILIVLKYQ